MNQPNKLGLSSVSKARTTTFLDVQYRCRVYGKEKVAKERVKNFRDQSRDISYLMHQDDGYSTHYMHIEDVHRL